MNDRVIDRDEPTTVFLSDDKLQAVEYVTIAEHKRVTAERDRLQEALDSAYNLLSEFTTGDSDDPIDIAVDILSTALTALQEAEDDRD